MASSDAPLLTLYAGDHAHNTHSLSLYATKLQLRLRHGGIPYTPAFATRNDAPKKKLPFVRFADTGDLMGDTALITQHLIAAGKLADLNAALSPEGKATDYCLQAMVEDRFWYFVNYERWFENFTTMRDSVFGHMPWGVRHAVGLGALQYARLMMYFQGTGRYTPDEVKKFTEEAIGLLGGLAEAAMGKKKAGGVFWILGGEGPSEADFTVFGAVSALLVKPTLQPKITAMIKGHPALMEYMEGINKVYFPDLEGWP